MFLEVTSQRTERAEVLESSFSQEQASAQDSGESVTEYLSSFTLGRVSCDVQVLCCLSEETWQD